MDTVDKVSRYAKERDYDIKVIGIPKTIDNDLMEIDHTPGFGSAAKYIATTFCELERDCNVYDMPAVTIVEVMGRNAGWLTAASALSRLNGAEGPSLIYLCEKEFDIDKFIEDVKEKLLDEIEGCIRRQFGSQPLANPDYGKMLLDFFDRCRKKMPIGYAKFHLPWVLEWYTANRQYKQAFEFLNNFPEK